MVGEMKVTQDGKQFSPITIVLETEEEAAIMWANLNDGLPDDGELDLPNTAGRTETQMYHALNDIYEAPDGKFGK